MVVVNASSFLDVLVDLHGTLTHRSSKDVLKTLDLNLACTACSVRTLFVAAYLLA